MRVRLGPSNRALLTAHQSAASIQEPGGTARTHQGGTATWKADMRT